jgi:co-chaperonin GroES (HSP10)
VHAVSAQKEEQQADFPITPLSDIVIIKQHKEETSKGGIVLLEKSQKFPCGRVVAVGPGRVYSSYLDASGHHMGGHEVPMRVKVGDWALFGKNQSGGEPIEIDGERYLMCREQDLAGVSRSGEPVFIKNAPTE